MNCLACSNCYRGKDEPNGGGKLPRVLVACGHTFCSDCIEQHFSCGKVQCFSCGKATQTATPDQLPLNESVLSLLSRKSPQQYLCRSHNLRLDAICEKDNELLCLYCISSTHKNHKYSAISDKVKKDKELLKHSHGRLLEAQHDTQQGLLLVDQLIDQLQQQYKDYLLEVGVFFRNLQEDIKAEQTRELARGKNQMEDYLRQLHASSEDIKSHGESLQSVQTIYDELLRLDDIEYLHEESKRIAVVECTRLKRKRPHVEQLEFKRVACLQQVISAMQEIAAHERKKVLGSLISESPMMRKQSSKEPTVLEVNLSEQYHKHQAKKKSQPAKGTITIATDLPSSRGKATSIAQSDAREMQAEIVGEARKQTNECYRNGDSSDGIDFSQNLESVNSFMQSSRVSANSNSLELSLKDCQSQFTLIDLEDRVYHFGGMGSSKIEASSSEGHNLLNAHLPYSRSQCLVWKEYSPDKILLIGGKANQNEQHTETIREFHHKRQDCVSKVAGWSLSEPRSAFGAVIKDSKLYIVGGSCLGPTNSFQQYSYTKSQSSPLKLRKMPSLSKQRDEVTCCLGLDGHLYAMGGINSSNVILSSCERYDWSKSQWEAIAPMKNCRRSSAAVALPDGLYIIGGHDGKKYLKQVQKYDYQKKKWTSMKPMPLGRCCHTAISSLNYQQITVYGGYNKGQLQSVQTYDLDIDEWRECPPLQQGKYMHCSCRV